LKKLKLFLFLILAATTLSAFTLKTNSVEEKKWGDSETLLKFLEQNSLPLKLYYDLDEEDKKVMHDINIGTTYYIAKDCQEDIYQVVIPLNEELEVHVYKNIEGKYKLEIIPISYTQKTLKVKVEITSSFIDSIIKSTHNYPMSLSLQRILKDKVNFKKLKSGDEVGIVYREKTWMNKKFGTQRVFATYFKKKNSKKKVYKFYYKGRYYDKHAKIKIKTSSFITPCRYRRISSKFTRKRWHPILHRYRPHHGIDYANRVGTRIWATYDGVVKYAGWVRGYGRYIELKHPNGYTSVYGHLSRIKVKKGQRVKKRQVIGLMGSSGMSTGSHLHFGIKRGGRWINPANKIVIVRNTRSKLRKKILAVIKKYKRILDKL